MDAKQLLTRTLPEYLPEFYYALKLQIEADNLRWGDTWKERGLMFEGQSQETRFHDWLDKKYSDHKITGEPLPWLKIAGEAFIGYIREKYLR